VDLKIKALALTDINTVTGIYDFYKLCQKYHIKPIVGSEIRVDNELYYICIAKSATGIAEINMLLTNYNCNNIAIPKTNPLFENTFVIYPMSNIPNILYENEFIGVREEELNFLVRPEMKKWIEKMVILRPVTFNGYEEYKLHKILRAIDRNTLISKLSEIDFCKKNETFTDKTKLLNCYKLYPKIIENTKYLVNSCSFNFEFSTPKNKKYFTDSKEHDFELLRQLALEGSRKDILMAILMRLHGFTRNYKLLTNSIFAVIF